MTRFWWVRHGPTHAKAMIGWTDLPADLSDTAALDRLSAYLPATAPVIASDLSRAQATADAIQGTRPRLPDDSSLREMHFGRWEMKRFDQIGTEDLELIRAYWSAPGEVRAPDGESWNDVTARVDPVVKDLALRHSGGDVIVVAHYGVILNQLALALEKAPVAMLAQRIENLSVTRIDIGKDGRRAAEINHLP
jgi:alpha-ribazole phosphatase